MSTTPHKARTEVWAAVERFSRNEMDIMNCVLELRARVEALERKAAMNELRAASAEARPATGEPTDRELRELFWYRPKGLETEAAALRRVYQAGMAAAVQSSAQQEIADAEAFGLTSTSGSLVDRSAPAPASSLVERLMCELGMTNPADAGIAIHAIADWLRTHGDPAAHAWAMRLEQEAAIAHTIQEGLKDD